MKHRFAAMGLIACVVTASCGVSGDNHSVLKDHVYTTDSGRRVEIVTTASPAGQSQSFSIMPRLLDTGPNQPPSQGIKEIVFQGSAIESIRVNDWMDGGLMCVWAVRDGDHFEYRWATWSSVQGGFGRIPVTNEMKENRFKVVSASNGSTGTKCDWITAQFEGSVGHATMRFAYLNPCAIGDNLDHVGDLTVVPLKGETVSP